MAYKMKGFSPFTKHEPGHTDPVKKEKEEVDQHNIDAEKINTTGKTCMTCGAYDKDHSNMSHKFKKYEGKPGPDTKPGPPNYKKGYHGE